MLRSQFRRLTALVFAVGAASLAQAQTTAAKTPRPLVLNQTHYRLKAGERIAIDAPAETLDFVRDAKSRTAEIVGAQGRGFALGPSMRGNEVMLAASLTMKPGEYGVTLSAVDQSGEERTAAAGITVDALPVVPTGGSTPPVVLLNGWQFSVFPPSGCPIATTGSVATFGALASQLVAPQVYFFDNCVEQSVNGSTIEELGVTLGQFLNMVQYAGGALVPQVDLISHSMGGLIVRSYLVGLQANDALSPVLNPRVRKFIEIATPNFGSFLAANWSDLLANGTQAAEMVPGSPFLWNLGTWNQRGDDLRGVDALAIIGSAGYWQSSNFSVRSPNESDGVVSLTSASLNFARDPSRTKILNYCHIDSASTAGAFIDCTGKGIADVDEAPETGVIILSFLANTTAWESEGYSNQTQFGAGYFALENAAGTQYTAFSSVLLGSQSFETGAGTSNTIFYNEFVNVGPGTFAATSTAKQATTCGPFTVTGGYYSIFRCKFSPVISSVGPLLPTAAGRVVTSGGSITINGVGFGQHCSACQVVAYPGPVALGVSSWSDSAITAFLPSTFNGIAEVSVEASAGSDSITFMASPPPSPTISLSNTQLQFTYTVGGAAPPSQTIAVSNSGGGTLTWSAASAASWLTLSPAPGTLAVSVNPAGLSANTYTGVVTITASAASNTPRTIAVTLTVTASTAAAPSIAVTSVTNAGSGASGAIAPGEIITIKGAQLGPANGVSFAVDSVTGMVEATLSGTSVFFGSFAAPITYTSAGQINAIVPYEIASQSPVTMQVHYQGTISIGTTLQVASAAPGAFTFGGTGSGQAVAANQDGTHNGPSNPAAKGSYVTIYFTGGGETNPPGVTGSVTGAVLKWLKQAVSVTVGNVPATVAFDGAAPTFVDGVGQLNIQLANNTPSGTQALVITVGDLSSPATATLSVQ